MTPRFKRLALIGVGLIDLFTRMRAIRRGIIDAGQEVDAPDFGWHQPGES